jgi:hypothetical protein
MTRIPQCLSQKHFAVFESIRPIRVIRQFQESVAHCNSEHCHEIKIPDLAAGDFPTHCQSTTYFFRHSFSTPYVSPIIGMARKNHQTTAP